VTRIGDTSNTISFNLSTICQQSEMIRDVETFERIEETIEETIPDSEVSIV
jgi:hypothetical protein